MPSSFSTEDPVRWKRWTPCCTSCALGAKVFALRETGIIVCPDLKLKAEVLCLDTFARAACSSSLGDRIRETVSSNEVPAGARGPHRKSSLALVHQVMVAEQACGNVFPFATAAEDRAPPPAPPVRIPLNPRNTLRYHQGLSPFAATLHVHAFTPPQPLAPRANRTGPI